MWTELLLFIYIIIIYFKNYIVQVHTDPAAGTDWGSSFPRTHTAAWIRADSPLALVWINLIIFRSYRYSFTVCKLYQPNPWFSTNLIFLIYSSAPWEARLKEEQSRQEKRTPNTTGQVSKFL